MTDTAVRLCGPAAVPAAAATQYTVPAGAQTILRNIHAINTDAAADALFTLSMGTDDVATEIFHCTIPAYGTLDWSGFMVMGDGEILQAGAPVGAVTLTISGIEVT